MVREYAVLSIIYHHNIIHIFIITISVCSNITDISRAVTYYVVDT